MKKILLDCRIASLPARLIILPGLMLLAFSSIGQNGPNLTPLANRHIDWLLSTNEYKHVPIEALDSLGEIAAATNDNKLHWYVEYYKMRRQNYWETDLNSILEGGLLKGCPYPEIKAQYWLFNADMNLRRFRHEIATRLLLHARTEFERTGYENLPDAGGLMNKIGLFYFYSGYPSYAIRYWQQALKYHFSEKAMFVTVLDRLGAAYMTSSIGNYQLAARFFLKGYHYARQYNKPYMWITRAHYGMALQLQKKFRQALPMLLDAYQVIPASESMFKAQTAISIAETYLELDSIAKAKVFADAYEYIVTNDKNDRSFHSKVKSETYAPKYYKIKAELCKLSGDFACAGEYQRALIYLQDSINSAETYRFLESNENLVNSEIYLAKINQIREERERDLRLRNLLILIIIVVTIITIYILRQHYQKLVLEKQSDERAIRFMKEDFEQAEESLNQQIAIAQDKSLLLDRVNAEMISLREQDNISKMQDEEIEQHIDKLLNSLILTETDWEDFQVIFEKVNPGFLSRLRTNYSDLTNAEVRLAALMRLNVPTREIALMLNISKETIHTLRYRLRRKFGFVGSEVGLINFINGI